MPTYTVPTNETQRLETLQSLGVVNGSRGNDCFDRIIRTASALFDVPIIMINLITSDKDVNVACFGINPSGPSEREISFCSYTILSDEPLIIEDTLKYDLFKEYPAVTGALHIRSYAGVPLTASDGTHPGTLCLVDTKPRKFSKSDIQLLKDLSHWAELELAYEHHANHK